MRLHGDLMAQALQLAKVPRGEGEVTELLRPVPLQVAKEVVHHLTRVIHL